MDYVLNVNVPATAARKLTATISWDRIIEWTDVDGDSNYDFGEFAIPANSLANLDLMIFDSTGAEIVAADAMGRKPFSKSPGDNVEHIYYTLPATDTYTIRVQNLSGFAATYGFAVWVVPEPSTFGLAALGLLVSARLLSA